MKLSPGILIAAGVVVLIAALAYFHLRGQRQGPSGTITAGGFHRGPNGLARYELSIGYLPVTCHLTCPVTDYASKHSSTGTNFNSLMFTEFPPIAEALKADQLQATFMIVPLAMKLREQGVPVKICYLGHRDGSTFVVAKDLKATSIKNLKGQKIAIPSKFSNQYLLLQKLMADNGMQPGDITFIVMPPPDMPTALASHSIAGFFVGEPAPAKSEIVGTGRVLYNSYDIDPNFVSCALVVRQDLIDQHPEVVRDLVSNIAASGMWADDHRVEAAKLAAPYFHQKESLLQYVLTQPGRVRYDHLTPTDDDMMKIETMAVQQGLLKRIIPLDQILDRDFIPKTIVPQKIDMSQAPAG
jgi:NitT/TauT family transport system substrate-binding protein